MDAHNDGRPDSTRWPYMLPGDDNESNVAMNQRMIGQLVRRKRIRGDLGTQQSRALMALGIEVSESREEKAGLSLKQAARQGGLDPAFLAIVEAGKAVPQEITGDVLEALARGSESSVESLKSAMSVDRSHVLERSPDATDKLVAVIFSLCSPDFSRSTLAFKVSSSFESDLFHDHNARLSYRVGNIRPGESLSLSFFEFQNPDAPLDGWNVSVRSGVEELLTGITDGSGLFRFPDGTEDFPENAHVLLRKPD